MKKKEVCILITSSGGIATTGIIDCLKNNYENRKIRVVCTDIISQPLLMYKSDKFYQVPKGNSRKYVNAILKICKKENVDVIFPGSGSEIFTLSKNTKIFRQNNIVVATSNHNSVKIIMDKVGTYDLLRKNDIPVPDYYRVTKLKEFVNAIKKLGYPRKAICFKPAKYNETGGARGFRILRKKNSLSNIVLKNKPNSVEIDYDSSIKLFNTTTNVNLLVMEYLPSQEYSVYVFCNNGNMLYCIPNKREKLLQYYSFRASIVENKQICNICKKIVKILGLDFNINLQFKISANNIPKLIEINPRIGGTIILPTVAGVNLPYLAIKKALNEKFPAKKSIKKITMIRYWKELFANGEKSFEINSNYKKTF